MTLDSFGAAKHLYPLTEGRYVIEYNDSSHLAEGFWLPLLHVDVREVSVLQKENSIEQFFTLSKHDLQGVPGLHNQEAERGLRTIADVLSLALARAGVLTPEVTEELLRDLRNLGEQDGVVIIPDTNALHNGAVHWLLRVLRRPAVWLMPLAASMTTVQTRDATVKGLAFKRKANSIVQALRSRGLVNGALGLLQRHRGRSQVVEIDPSLLRYQRTGSDKGADPDQSDVLEDRLIIEAIHSVLRTMRSRTARRVVTSDVNLARVLEAEGVETLFVPTVQLGEKEVPCIRFDPYAKAFVGAPLRAILWELTLAFGSIRLCRDKEEHVRLSCYWAGKTPAEWSNETLAVDISSPSPSTNTLRHAASGSAFGDEPGLQPPPAAGDEVVVEGFPPTDQGKDRTKKPRAQRGARARARPSVRGKQATLPRASLPTLLRTLGSLDRHTELLPSDLLARFTERTSEDTIRRCLDLLERIQLVERGENGFRALGDVVIVDHALQQGDLDTISGVFERFEPYKLLLEELRQRGRIAKTAIVDILREKLGSVGQYEAERLSRFHVLLGQAWTLGEDLRNGSARPTDRDATELFQQAFDSVSRDGLANVADLLPRFAELSDMSPWAAKSLIGRFIADRLLPEYTFEPSAGSKPITRDEVIAGDLATVHVMPVVVDRLILGERPVFTVGGPER